jgi:hypothetical protein
MRTRSSLLWGALLAALGGALACATPTAPPTPTRLPTPPAVSTAVAVPTVAVPTVAVPTATAQPARPCTALNIVGRPPSPVSADTSVTFSATATCRSTPVQYRWYVRSTAPGSVWIELADWGSNELTWDTGDFGPGTYYVEAHARVSDSPTGLDISQNVEYEVR